MEIDLINYESALERLGGDKEFLSELLTEMINQVDQQFDELDEAVKNSDFNTIHSAAHGLKGASANLDLTRFVHLFRILEEQGSNGKLEGAEALLEEVKKSKEELSAFVETL